MDATDDRDWRYQQIMARLQKRQVRAPANSATDELAAALDAVGAMHLLEVRGRGAIWGWYGYGPKVAREASNWVGVVGWWRRSSFYAYETAENCSAFGAFRAKDEGERCVIILGERELAFRGAFHNPESFASPIAPRFSRLLRGREFATGHAPAQFALRGEAAVDRAFTFGGGHR